MTDVSEPTFRVETETVERVKHIVLDVSGRPGVSMTIRDYLRAPVGACAEVLTGMESIPVVNREGERIGRVVGVEFDPEGTIVTVEVPYRGAL